MDFISDDDDNGIYQNFVERRDNWSYLNIYIFRMECKIYKYITIFHFSMTIIIRPKLGTKSDLKFSNKS